MSDDVTALVWGALMPGVSTHPVEPWVTAAIHAGVESVCLFSDAVGSAGRVADTVHQLRAARSDLLVAIDEEGGEVTRLQSQTGSYVLAPLALGVIGDIDVTRATGRILGRWLREAGVDWTFAPVADVNVDPRNPVIGVRSFGADADAVAAQVAAMVAGIQSVGVAATAKHFPGHGDTHVDSHEALPTLSADSAALEQRELAPFRSAIAQGVAAVMTGHLLLPALDADQPASLSRAITTGLLRESLGFTGTIVTDAVEMRAVAGGDRGRLPAAVVAALVAGADVVCLGAADQERATAASAAAVLSALDSGELSLERLMDAAGRRRALAAHLGGTAPAPETHCDADEATIAAAASRSLLLRGDVRLAGSAVDVLRISADAGYAAGQTRWGVARHLADVGIDVAQVASVPGGVSRDLVIEVREAWKDPALVAALGDALRQRPDAVIVDLGWPMPDLPASRGVITTHGTGELSSALAACTLVGGDCAHVASTILAAARPGQT